MNLVDNCRYFYITSRMFNGFNAASAAAAALLVILGAQWGNEASGRNRWKGKWGGRRCGVHTGVSRSITKRKRQQLQLVPTGDNELTWAACSK